MTNTILRPNAAPLYAFLSLIHAKNAHEEHGHPLKILDCGAGGPVPPLALFYEHGFETWGIDLSDEQLERARRFCEKNQMQIKLQNGDMRQIPFEDESFDCVYEHYSMCHLSKQETAKAINEMYRVTKKQGLCFLGVISMDSWPKSIFGVEQEPGEFWNEEGNDKSHSLFTNQEADQLVSDWEVLKKEKNVIYLHDQAERTSLDTWMEMYAGMETEYTEDIWRDRYDQRKNQFNYSHIYYFLRKPG
jgi:ubiquinone/menaquinone biosynthesis C-methylase UbiE